MASNETVPKTLRDMGFEEQKVETCLNTLAISSGGFEVTLEAAIEWLLADRNKENSGSSVVKPDQAMEVVSRYHMSEQQVKDKKTYEAKERQAALKKNREMKMAEVKARELIKRQIADDRAARETKIKPTSDKNDTKIPSTSHWPTNSCAIQVRLPAGDTIRQNFQPDSTLGDVLAFLVDQRPKLAGSQLSLVQPFPRKQFVQSEYALTLKSLGLCPSSSLIAVQERKQKDDHSPPVTDGVVVGTSSDVTSDAIEQPNTLHDEVEGSNMEHSPVHHTTDEVMDTSEQGEEQREEEDHEIPVAELQPVPIPPLPHRLRHRRFRQPIDEDEDDDEMEGDGDGDEFGGYRLGGHDTGHSSTEVASMDVVPRENVADAVRLAALRRATASTIPAVSSHSSPTTSGLQLQASRLEEICVKFLVRRSRDYGLPSCSGLSSFVAESLITALAENKMLNTKTLTSFSRCTLYKVKLDGYIYMTNELLTALRVHPSLTCLSCRSSPVITDRGVSALIPCLKQLEILNLSFCKQLTGRICGYVRHCRQLVVLQVSGLDKLTDEDIAMLFGDPFDHLTELDVSHTPITDRSLEAVAKGAPNLQNLNCEHTKLETLRCVGSMAGLTTLNISNCLKINNIQEVQKCSSLQCLSLAGLKLSHEALTAMQGLNLSVLKLSDRNCFMDTSMSIVAGFPLQSLDLSDYCHITDVGIAHVAAMHSMSVLLLSRTKLTDDGMPSLAGLTNLQELSLDNTVVTDDGIKYIANLHNLVYLSLSDTKVTSEFIIDGTLQRLYNLSKLNLSRTSVDDEGAFGISLSFLQMLNLEWTLCTDVCTIEELRNRGCSMLQTLRVSNITQKTHQS
ncbi:uncharacterized protein [Dysidea avara]|uniref:uncharacterized protein isoform X2 n=1 Tax=Dysidea avara TaxID=196820 RepID=UPI00331AA83F